MFNKENTSELFCISKIDTNEKTTLDFSKTLNAFSKTIPVLDTIVVSTNDENKECIFFKNLRDDVEKSFEQSSCLFDNSKNKTADGIAIDKIIN